MKLFLLYCLASAGAEVSARIHASTISANSPIRHGRWLAIWVCTALGLAALTMRSWWALLAALGMMGVFSAVFRTRLNLRREKGWAYVGPVPAWTKDVIWVTGFSLWDALDWERGEKRSQYDVVCWFYAHKFGTRPVFVAFGLELAAATLTYLFL